MPWKVVKAYHSLMFVSCQDVRKSQETSFARPTGEAARKGQKAQCPMGRIPGSGVSASIETTSRTWASRSRNGRTEKPFLATSWQWHTMLAYSNPYQAV